MKKNIKIIIIAGVVLLLYPFIGLSEFWEYVYVTAPAFLIVYSALRIMKNKKYFSDNSDDVFDGYLKKITKKIPSKPREETSSYENRRINGLKLQNNEHEDE